MALVQGYPQQNSSIAMLQARPASAGGIMTGQPQYGQSYVDQSHRSRGSFSGTPTGYRGSSTVAQPRVYASPPVINHNIQWQQYAAANRSSPSSAPPMTQTFDPSQYRLQHPSSGAAGYSQPYGAPVVAPRDDSSTIVRNMGSMQRPQSNYYVPGQGSANVTDKYRRANAQAVQHNRTQSANMAANQHAAVYQLSQGSFSVPNLPGGKYSSRPSSPSQLSFANRAGTEDAFQARRRSAASIDARPGSAHSRNGSGESASSGRSSISRPSSAHRHNASVSTITPSSDAGKPEQAQPIPARGSSADAIKRTISPSPLSRQANLGPDAADEAAASLGTSPNLNSPAAKHLAALNQKGTKSKSKTSRLRRAFSFGSAADFRKADEEEAKMEAPSKLQKQPTAEQAYDAEQARIVQAQEAGGIGNSIYGSRFFGSTDNLSISSTASSASIMLRKMGRGVKKGTRSLAGLFRPKSAGGVPVTAAPLEPETSQAMATMTTVEAETQLVGVTPDPATGTGFPHLERNSLDASRPLELPEIPTERLGSSGTDRRSIVGGDFERAEVLAAVRKGILKRPGSASPSIRPVDISPELMLPPIPVISDSPISSAPSTPNDDAQGHRRTGSIALASDDFFVNALRSRSDSKSAPGTPQGGKRSATFSPRIIFHDTWPPQEYDRRGDVATCNRLTPLLAQQIKEELNTFKMEMEVHENSKIYTHFF